MKGVAGTSPHRTNNFLFMVASLGQPAATMPQLGPSFEATNDITKGPSSDTKKPVVVSLVAQFEGLWMDISMKILRVAKESLISWEVVWLLGEEQHRQSRWISHKCCISPILACIDDQQTLDWNQIINLQKSRICVSLQRKKEVHIHLDGTEQVKDVASQFYAEQRDDQL